ncbi:MAG TPA: amidohydrolase family protein [candidate division Zixibacteria bacterium]|nr:amidohydrolase family protein [candidate division Zixibacteria bacterium]
MNLRYGCISADDHVQEPPDLWTRRLPKSRWGERIPRLERTSDGAERWVLDGKVLLGGAAARAGAFTPDRRDPRRWEEVPPEAYDPAARLRAMDEAGVDCSVLYPSVAGLAGEAFGRLEDPELEIACVRAYNDWLIESWGAASERFVPQCIVPIWPVEETVQEIRRAVAMGHRGVVFPSLPMHLRRVPHVSGPEYDPLWSACEELDVPVCLHAGASAELQYGPAPGLRPVLAEALDAVTRPVSSVFVLSLYSFSRILLRHPQLRLVFAESALSWAMLYMEWADHQFEHDGLAREGYDLKPSEMFHRQCFLTSWFDPIAPFVSYVGADHILWCGNLPSATSTWPRTRETRERCLREVSADDREKISWRNAARLYRL